MTSDRGRRYIEAIDQALTPLLDDRDALESTVEALRARLQSEALAFGTSIEDLKRALAAEREHTAGLAARLDQVEGELALSRSELGITQRELNAQTAALASLRRAAEAFSGSVKEVLGANADVAEADSAFRNDALEDEVRSLIGHNRGPTLVAPVMRRP